MFYINYLKVYINKKLSFGKSFSGGRNFLGRVCINARGSISKRRYLFIDFFRRINNFGYLVKILKDSNRTAFIGLLLYDNGLSSYILLTESVSLGHKIYSGNFKKKDLVTNLNWAVPLRNINLFTQICAIELFPSVGSTLVRSAGCCAIAIGKVKNKVILKMPSGWQLYISNKSLATVGQVSNYNFKFTKVGKAGKMRALGFRSNVRGVAKNPVDHAHGGGNGKKAKPCAPVSAIGKLNKTHTNSKKFHLKLRRKFFKKV